MRMTWVFLALAALSGCQKGDGLVVVTVNASIPIQGVSALQATATIAGSTRSFAVPTGNTPFDLPPAKTFGISLPSSMSGTLSLHLEADDATGAPIAQGDGTITVTAGSRADLSIDLNPIGGDMGLPDANLPDGGSDAATDGAVTCDGGSVTACGPSCVTCPVPQNGVATCNGTACDVQCNANYHACAGACVSNTDVASCGPSSCTPCTVPTGGSATCDGTQCGGSCPSGMQLCLGACIANGMACSGTCPSGQHDCAGLCDSNTSVNSCGTTSCAPCPAIVSGTATCDGTKCGYTCNTGTHDCGGGNCASNTSINTCGTSCTPCPSAPANGTETCNGTSCGFTCMTGYVPSGASCAACGALGQPCCTGSTCSSGLSCGSGTCNGPWQVVSTAATSALYGVWGSSTGDVLAVGPSAGVFHSTGGGAAFNTISTTNDQVSIWGTSSTDAYGVGTFYSPVLGKYLLLVNYSSNDGSSWSSVDTGGNYGGFNGVWGSASNNVYFVGSNGLNAIIFHSAGAGGAASALTVPSSGDALESIWGSAANDIYAVGGATIFHFNGSQWLSQATPSGVSALDAVWGSGPLDVYAASGNGGLIHTSNHGTTWTLVALPAAVGAIGISSLWGSSSMDIFAVGSGIAHFDGSIWAVQPLPITLGTGRLHAVWGSASNDVYAVGQDSGANPLALHHP